LRFRLIPREEKFFDDFVAVTDQIRFGAGQLETMLATEPPHYETADAIKETEHACDQLAHEIFHRLHRTFVTPIDREDIHAIAGALDDVMDAIDASAGLIRIYRLERLRPGTRELVRIIVASTDALGLAMRNLESKKGVSEHVVEINRLENEADRVHQHAIMQLFDEEKDPVAILKWKEILDCLEDTTDRCEDVGDLLEGVVLKHA